MAAIVAERERAGDAAGYDSLRAEREVLALEESRSAARASRARAQAGLAGFLSQVADTTHLVAAMPEPRTARVPVPALDELLARARSVRGEVAASQKEIEAARLGERAAGRRLVPEPELVVGTKSSTFGGGDTGGVLSVHVPLPIFNAAKPEQARARARLAQAEASALAFDAALRAQVAGVREALLEHRQAAERHRSFWSTRADELERIAQVSYDAGERGILELLDAYRSGAAARVRQAELDAAVRRAEIELELVSGWEVQ
jgi:cobalt-zinc-cadmium efflux system outer membrane protein